MSSEDAEKDQKPESEKGQEQSQDQEQKDQKSRAKSGTLLIQLPHHFAHGTVPSHLRGVAEFFDDVNRRADRLVSRHLPERNQILAHLLKARQIFLNAVSQKVEE